MKLIIRAPNWVGDAVMALPAVDNARDITGASHIAVMARKSTAPLFANHPDVDLIAVIDDQHLKKVAVDAVVTLLFSSHLPK